MSLFFITTSAISVNLSLSQLLSPILHPSIHAAPGEWYLPEGFLTQPLDQDSDCDFTVGGANVNESLQETYRDRLLAGFESNAQDSAWSHQEEINLYSEARQEILNLLGTKYGFYMEQQEEEEQQFVKDALEELKGGLSSKNDDYYSKPPPPVRQNTIDLSVLKDDSAMDEKSGEESGSETESYPKKGFQARSNTLNLTEFDELAELQKEDQCSQPGFLEELQEGLRRRGLKWTLSTEDLSPSNEEQSQTEPSDNVVDASQEFEATAPSEDALSEEEGEGDSIMHTLTHCFQL